MTTKTIAERIVDAYHAGKEAVFYSEDVAYEFTPIGIADYIGDAEGYLTEADVVTQAELVSAGGNITIPVGSTLDEAIQLIIDAVDPEV